jgi:hypothetical protein
MRMERSDGRPNISVEPPIYDYLMPICMLGSVDADNVIASMEVDDQKSPIHSPTTTCAIKQISRRQAKIPLTSEHSSDRTQNLFVCRVCLI